MLKSDSKEPKKSAHYHGMVVYTRYWQRSVGVTRILVCCCCYLCFNYNTGTSTVVSSLGFCVFCQSDVLLLFTSYGSPALVHRIALPQCLLRYLRVHKYLLKWIWKSWNGANFLDSLVCMTNKHVKSE